jgi:hypothetical protein
MVLLQRLPDIFSRCNQTSINQQITPATSASPLADRTYKPREKGQNQYKNDGVSAVAR